MCKMWLTRTKKKRGRKHNKTTYSSWWEKEHGSEPRDERAQQRREVRILHFFGSSFDRRIPFYRSKGKVKNDSCSSHFSYAPRPEKNMVSSGVSSTKKQKMRIYGYGSIIGRERIWRMAKFQEKYHFRYSLLAYST
uniref:Uncharacterized protein n=1 Tax=Anopheles atroparvus TaxID=41427 RepID=A0AAG5CXM8_ANOAO